MENFTVYNPVKLHFGRNATDNLGKIAKEYGSKALLIYGKSSAKKYNYLEKIKSKLNESKVEIVEYSGIKSNPIVDNARKAIELAQKENISLIVAVGGGSVIDTAKVVSACIPDKIDPWDLMKGIENAKNSIPLLAVLTLAATGTEMNPFAVLQNHETNEKIGFGSELMFPRHSFLNPEFTYSVSANYTSYGIADIIAHSFETYFGYGKSPLSERFAANIVVETLKFGPLVLSEPKNYDYRANIMWQATCALNGTTSHGKAGGDWGVHDMGHILSLLYDVPHGASLSIIYPAWLEIFKNKIPKEISKLGDLIFGTKDIDMFIEKLRIFFVSINCPISLKDFGINDDKKPEILERFIKNKVSGFNYKLNVEDYNKILSLI